MKFSPLRISSTGEYVCRADFFSVFFLEYEERFERPRTLYSDVLTLFSENRFTPIYDFGYVAMIMGWVFAEDSGEYLCRATNLYGMDETRAVIKSTSRPGVIYDSQIPKGMQSLEKIRELESSWQM